MARKPHGRSGPDLDNRAPSDFEVGYGKPPRHSRFQPGRSGNPRGKPKGSVNLQTLVEQELQQLTEVVEAGRRIKLTKLELLVKTMVNRGIKGDGRAVQQILQLADKSSVGPMAAPVPANDDADSATDQEILNRLLARHARIDTDDDDPA